MTSEEIEAYELPPPPVAQGPSPAVVRRAPSEAKDDPFSSPGSGVVESTLFDHAWVDAWDRAQYWLPNRRRCTAPSGLLSAFTCLAVYFSGRPRPEPLFKK